MHIRVAEPGDIEDLFEIRTSVVENHQSREELASIGVTPESIAAMLASTARAWIATDEGRSVAFSMADSVDATVFAMFVRPGFEGRGYGRALMGAAERWLAAEGCTEAYLLTGADPSIRANGFYEHLGWTNVGKEPDGQNRYVKRLASLTGEESSISVEPHPLLRVACFEARYPLPLERLDTPPQIGELLRPDAPSELRRTEDLRVAVRDVLRHAGYKPTGRGKPASEYLLRAAGEGSLAPVNVAVDAGNAISLQSGLPISVVDPDRGRPPFRIAIAEPGLSYVFNPGGQEIELAGLPCLFDADGPCANAVRDSQRTKTHAGTERTLSIVWGSVSHIEELESAVRAYCRLLALVAASTARIALRS